MRRMKNDHSATSSRIGTIQPSTSGSQRLMTSPLYFTPCASRSATRVASSIRTVVNPGGPSAFLSVPRIIVSPTNTSATWPPRTSDLNSL